MLPFKTLIKIDLRSNRSIYLQLADQLIRLIQMGTIPKSSKLPGSRKMAEMLSINRQTVIAAYEEVEHQGWIVSKASKGTFVRNDLPIITPQNWNLLPKDAVENVTIPINPSNPSLVINRGSPDDRLAPIDAIARAYRSALKSSIKSRALINIDVFQQFHNEQIIADYLNKSRGLRTSAQEIMITQGSQMGIYLSANAILQVGDTIAIGRTSYIGADKIFEGCGAKLIHIDVDNDGINVDQIENYCKKNRLHCIYITPHHHLPTTVTLSVSRRMKLLELANIYDFHIIEDDYDFDFHYASSPILPMASVDDQCRVVYVGSMSKILAPGIRFGYVVAGGKIFSRMFTHRKNIDRYSDLINSRAICSLIQEGEIDRHLRKSIQIYKTRRDQFCSILTSSFQDEISFIKPAGGLAIWAKFNSNIDIKNLAKKVFDKGLFLPDGSIYNRGSEKLNASRLGFASLNKDEIEKALQILRDCL